ncbi:Imm49 family immunity protein [Sorangium sp. So ce1000]|uniref:Imm49 family immunity protein n=1 Tax=Sorangium sp. So ce1000 TaxID=3133325 RepID=UPI003F6216A1
MKLAEHGEALAYDIAFWMAAAADPGYPIVQLDQLSVELSGKLRALAIMVLLVKADSDRFYHNLIRSGLVRETYLRRCRDEVFSGHHRVSGRIASLLDSIAAGEIPLARRIAALSPAEHRQGHEYEDDYCYAQVLHLWVADPARDEGIAPILDYFEAFLEGRTDPRLDCCRALWTREQKPFDEAFDALLAERVAETEAAIERGQEEEPSVVSQRYVSIEGLALLRLAEARGLSTRREYPLCPSLARVPMVMPFPGE